MHTETIYDPAERVTSIGFQPEQYDAFPPSPKAWVDGRIVGLHRNREALSHALLLFPYISGRLHPQSGCGVAVAGPLRDLFLPRNVLIEQIALAPQQVPAGTRTALICDGSYRSAALRQAMMHDLVFRLSESAYTSMISPRNVTISSNFGLFAQSSGQLHSLLPAIAAAVMFSEDLGISKLMLPVHNLTVSENELLNRLSSALIPVNMSLITPILDMQLDELAGMLPPLAGLKVHLSETHEHCRFPEDIADYWIAKVLSARMTGDVRTLNSAVSKLRAFSTAGHPFTARESALIWSEHEV